MNIYDFHLYICQSTFPCICVCTLMNLPAFMAMLWVNTSCISFKCSSVLEKKCQFETNAVSSNFQNKCCSVFEMNGLGSKQMQECVYNEGSVRLRQTLNFILD